MRKRSQADDGAELEADLAEWRKALAQADARGDTAEAEAYRRAIEAFERPLVEFIPRSGWRRWVWAGFWAFLAVALIVLTVGAGLHTIGGVRVALGAGTEGTVVVTRCESGGRSPTTTCHADFTADADGRVTRDVKLGDVKRYRAGTRLHARLLGATAWPDGRHTDWTTHGVIALGAGFGAYCLCWYGLLRPALRRRRKA